MSWCICICIYIHTYIHIISYTCISNDIYVVSVSVQGDVFCAFCVPFQVDGQLLEKAKLDGGGCIMRNPSPTVVTVVYKKCVLISVLQDSRLLPYSQVRISVKSNFEIKFAKDFCYNAVVFFWNYENYESHMSHVLWCLSDVLWSNE